MHLTRILTLVAVSSTLLVPRPVSAFYNSQTGRWLSRDPVGEEMDPNVYAFLGNDPVGYVDGDGRAAPANPGGTRPKPPKKPKPDPFEPLDHLVQAGLVPRCSMVVYLGHNRAESPHVPVPIRTSSDGCSAASVVACWSGTITVETPIPGIEPRPDEYTKLNLVQAEVMASNDFEAAKRNAYRFCGKKCCCKQVLVSVDCTGLSSAERRSAKSTCGLWYQLICPNNH
jgi:hypothetical protein